MSALSLLECMRLSLYVSLYIYLSIYLSVDLSVYLPICLYPFFFCRWNMKLIENRKRTTIYIYIYIYIYINIYIYIYCKLITQKKKKKKKNNMVEKEFINNVSTNTRKWFLALVDKHFPTIDKHSKFIKQLFEVRCGCMPNFKQAISNHHKRLLLEQNKDQSTREKIYNYK